MDKTRYFLFQVAFYALSTLILHLALFDFIGEYYSGEFQNWNQFTQTFLNWLPVIIFDFLVGIFLGIINALLSVTISNDLKNIRKVIITTNIIWLVFCLLWYLSNRGAINKEAIGHVFSPFIVGFVGMLLALINLAATLSLNKTPNQTS